MPKQNGSPEPEEVLSFDELKKKLADDDVQADVQTDAQLDSLLSELRDVPENPPTENEQTPPDAERPDAERSDAERPDAESDPTEPEDYKSIYDDVLRSVMGKTPSAGMTGRKSKFLTGNDQFVDVTAHYEDYADLTNERPSEEEPPLPPQAAQDADAVQEDEEKHYRTFNEIFRDGFRKIFPNKHDTVGEGIRKALLDLSVLTLCGCLVYFGLYALQSRQAKKQNEDIKQQLIEDSDIVNESDVWAQFLSKYPNIRLPEGIMPKYAYLYAINQDLVGWLKVPNSIIDVQVVQGADNSEYLKKDFYGNYSRYGCPYLDYRNDPKYLQKNTIVYGHHMSDGLVFADLKKYQTIEGFQESPVIQFDTLYRSYTFKVYAAFVSNSREKDDGDYIFNYTVTDFGSNDNFMKYIAAVDERKYYTTGVDILPTDKILTLSTCSYEFSDARLVVIGRLLRDGESAAVDTTLATANENPRFPQAYYDKMGQTNPYADAPKWTP